MIIEYTDRPDQQDPLNHRRYLRVEFIRPEELAALNSRGTADRVINYVSRALNAFLAENRKYVSPSPPALGFSTEEIAALNAYLAENGSQLDRGRSE
jgi:hypothetical protein